MRETNHTATQSRQLVTPANEQVLFTHRFRLRGRPPPPAARAPATTPASSSRLHNSATPNGNERVTRSEPSESNRRHDERAIRRTRAHQHAATQRNQRSTNAWHPTRRAGRPDSNAARMRARDSDASPTCSGACIAQRDSGAFLHAHGEPQPTRTQHTQAHGSIRGGDTLHRAKKSYEDLRRPGRTRTQ